MASIICRYRTDTTQICMIGDSFSDVKVNGESLGYVPTTSFGIQSADDEIEFILTGTTIGEKAFYGITGLTSIDLSASITEIGYLAFYDCKNLTDITCRRVFTKFNQSAFRNVKSNGTLHYPTNGLYGNWLSPYPYTLGYYDWVGVASVAADTVTDFKTSRLKCTYALDETISIGGDEVIDVKLNGVSVGSGQSFSVSPADEVEVIITGDVLYRLFINHNIKTVKLIDGFKTISKDAFYLNETLEEVILCDGIETIGSYAFYKTGIKTITLPDSVTNLVNPLDDDTNTNRYGMFQDCTNLKSVIMGKGITVIPNSMFSGCTSLEDVIVGCGVTEVKSYAFYNTAITTITLPDTVTKIKNAFGECRYLTTVVIGSGCIWIDVNSFSGCTSLNEIFIKSPTCEFYAGSETYMPNAGTLYYPVGGDYEKYEEHTAFSEWALTPTDVNDMPDTSACAVLWSVDLKPDYLIFDASGGTQLIDATVSGTPDGSLSWSGVLGDYGTSEYMGQFNDNPITVIYSITADANDGAARTIYFTVTGTDSTGSASDIITIYQKDNNGNLPNDFNEDMSTGCYINLDSYEYTFPATGGTYFVRAEFGFPAANSGLKTRVFSGSVYPIAWCTTELNGGEVDDDGAEANEVWKITMSENTGDARQCSVSFSYTNNYGESTSVVFTAKQAAAEGEEDSDPLVSAFTTSAKVNADGTPVIPSFTSIRCGYNKVTVLTPTVYYDGGSTVDWITLGAGSVVNGTFIGYDEVREYPISFAVNKGTARTGKIIFSGTDASGNTLTSICSIAQAIADAGGDDEDPEIPDTPTDSNEITFAPIWKDTVYTFGGTDVVYGIYVESRVYVGGQWITYDELLFKGRAYAKPNETVVNVMINKICQNYLHTIDTLFNGAVGVANPFGMFKLKNEYGTLLHTYYFVGDWSYSPLTLGVKTNPITPYIGDGQKLFFSTLAQEQQTVKWGMRYYNGTADYDNTEYLTNDYMTNVVTESRQKGVDSFYINDKEYNVLPKCQCKWVLYYLNPYGGYDWFVITGRVKRNDRLETYTITQNYNNTTSEFGKKRYLSTINVNYQINTQWLTQEQSDRMWELMESNQVWLHNLETDEIMPVIITDTEVEHKQKTNLNRMISYQINVELSQGRERM